MQISKKFSHILRIRNAFWRVDAASKLKKLLDASLHPAWRINRTVLAAFDVNFCDRDQVMATHS
jgi:hypothetical protein